MRVFTFSGTEEDDLGEHVGFAAQVVVFPKGSIYVWLGDARGEAKMSSLTACFPFREDFAASKVFQGSGGAVEIGEGADPEATFAKRLSKRLHGTPCFVSWSLSPLTHPLTIAKVEGKVAARIAEELEAEK